MSSYQGQSHAEKGNPEKEVVCAIERVDQPGILGAVTRSAAFLAQYLVLGIFPMQYRCYGLFGKDVCLGGNVALPFPPDRGSPSEMFQQDASRCPGGAISDVKCRTAASGRRIDPVNPGTPRVVLGHFRIGSPILSLTSNMVSRAMARARYAPPAITSSTKPGLVANSARFSRNGASASLIPFAKSRF